MVRIAMLSRWHVHAQEYADEINSLENAQVVAVWDEAPIRGQKWASSLSVPFETDLDKLLARDDIDAVAVVTPTNMHPTVMLKAAQAGKHIFTEKVMAITVKECQEIAAAVKAAGVKFCISFPRRGLSKICFAKEAIDQDYLGQPTLLRIRVAHNGALANWLPDHFYDPVLCGGGAMIDLGAHGMYIARWLLGSPKRIVSVFNNFTQRAVDDNTVSVIEFHNGAIAINETSFVSHAGVFYVEISGTEGSLMIGGPEAEILIKSQKYAPASPGWVEPSPVPEPLPSPITQWIDGILNDGPIHYGLEEGIQLTELMEAAYQAHREGRAIDFLKE